MGFSFPNAKSGKLGRFYQRNHEMEDDTSSSKQNKMQSAAMDIPGGLKPGMASVDRVSFFSTMKNSRKPAPADPAISALVGFRP